MCALDIWFLFRCKWYEVGFCFQGIKVHLVETWPIVLEICHGMSWNFFLDFVNIGSSCYTVEGRRVIVSNVKPG